MTMAPLPGIFRRFSTWETKSCAGVTQHPRTSVLVIFRYNTWSKELDLLPVMDVAIGYHPHIKGTHASGPHPYRSDHIRVWRRRRHAGRVSQFRSDQSMRARDENLRRGQKAILERREHSTPVHSLTCLRVSSRAVTLIGCRYECGVHLPDLLLNILFYRTKH